MNKEQIQQKFFDHVKQFHNNKYDYSNSVHITLNQKIIIICPIHGEFTQIASNHLRFGCNKCGYKRASEKLTIHLDKDKRLHKAWTQIKQRCNNKNNPSFKYYGGRGIYLSKDLTEYVDFKNYITSLDNYDKYNSMELTIDRIDNNKGYEKGNLRLVGWDIQAHNKGKTVRNKSGFLGVHYHKLNKKWCAKLRHKNKNIFLGYFDSSKDAAKKYDEYVKENKLPKPLNFKYTDDV